MAATGRGLRHRNGVRTGLIALALTVAAMSMGGCSKDSARLAAFDRMSPNRLGLTDSSNCPAWNAANASQADAMHSRWSYVVHKEAIRNLSPHGTLSIRGASIYQEMSLICAQGIKADLLGDVYAQALNEVDAPNTE